MNFLLSFFDRVQVALAQTTLLPTAPDGDPTKYTFCHLLQLGENVFNFLITLSLILAVAAMVYGGARIMVAAGEPANVQTGKSAIKAAVFGVLIIFGSGLIVRFIIRILSGGDIEPWTKLTCVPTL
ncbi:MAG: hypothetical protein A3H06_00820 [Candidatus Colwellbacteria bacterium RIFCSPLOWO2_12_FULL_44_13]|uniref:Uncharacterized protein n=3 Tax=Candidatus Colwelliibacteriota TaxID=1817904 RepID=A0A1G1Z7D7_9BACT|nr:MAG: hypothetical protein A3F24_00060 [Candidatus Colwellbacteria bacterium RIFCSPHIGHO2_12_FULL_44_17]OGY59790.1 MAG: hypothetical protein A3I31_01125 [Candidatus Colwellbacteria bacterium RIFCSPLOWO2_02_FULL_44_20b]OGY61396.1 MAG: hypothetical protein A3H06_00820 [Candidatus Colwellbacteria bacterium RIFCSPLOWO2_12_FULL_44_13]